MVHSQLLRYLVAVGGVAAKSRAELADQFRLPKHGGEHEGLPHGRAGAVTRAEEQKALLLEKSMSETLLDDIRAQVDEMESALETARVGRTDHIGARTDLGVITASSWAW